MLKVGDVVVTMSYPGLFTIVAITGDDVTIADGEGIVRIVRSANVRTIRHGDTPTS